MQHPSKALELAEPRRSRKKWLIALGAFIGILFLPVGCEKPMQPFDPASFVEYRIETLDGKVRTSRIGYFLQDTLRYYHPVTGEIRLPVSSIARISVRDTTYYLCPPCKFRQGEVMATKKQKWPPDRGEKWNVGGVLVLLIAAALGMLH